MRATVKSVESMLKPVARAIGQDILVEYRPSGWYLMLPSGNGLRHLEGGTGARCKTLGELERVVIGMRAVVDLMAGAQS